MTLIIRDNRGILKTIVEYVQPIPRRLDMITLDGRTYLVNTVNHKIDFDQIVITVRAFD